MPKTISSLIISGLIVGALPFFLNGPMAQPSNDKGVTKKIDVHAHLHSPEIFNAIETICGEKKGPGWGLLKRRSPTQMQVFTIEERMEWMNKYGIERSVFNFASVYLYMRDEKAQTEQRKKICRFVNDHFAKLQKRYPEKALFMADVALTAGDLNFSKKELHRAIKELGLKGICIPTNIGGKALSDPEFEDFFTEVDRLGLPVVTHPESPYGMSKMMNHSLYAIVGFTNDQALMAANLILSGFMERNKNIKIILTHLGGSIPYFYERLNLSPSRATLPKPPSEYLKHFYYDTAIGNPDALKFLLSFLGSSDRILFGTDHPYVDSAESKTVAYIEKSGLGKQERDKIYFKNAEKLFGL